MTHDKELIERLALKVAKTISFEHRAPLSDTSIITFATRLLAAYLAGRGKEAVAWMSPGKERLEFSRPDTVYGSHTLPLFLGPQVFELDAEYERGKSDGWEACETCHGIVDGKLPTRPVGDTDFEPKTCPEAYLQQEIAKLRKQPAIPEGWLPDGDKQIPSHISKAGADRLGQLGISVTFYEIDEALRSMLAAIGVKP